MNFLIPIFIGLFAGLSSGLFGIGGGIVIVPLVLYFYKFSQQTATATSLIALLLPVGSLGLWQFHKSGFITLENFKVGLLIAAGMFIGTFFGAKLGTLWLKPNKCKGRIYEKNFSNSIIGNCADGLCLRGHCAC